MLLYSGAIHSHSGTTPFMHWATEAPAVYTHATSVSPRRIPFWESQAQAEFNGFICQLRCGGKALASRIQYPLLFILEPENVKWPAKATVERPPEAFKLSDQSQVGPSVHAVWFSTAAEG